MYITHKWTHISSALHDCTVQQLYQVVRQYVRKRQRKASWYDPGFNGTRFLRLQRSGDFTRKINSENLRVCKCGSNWCQRRSPPPHKFPLSTLHNRSNNRELQWKRWTHVCNHHCDAVSTQHVMKAGRTTSFFVRWKVEIDGPNEVYLRYKDRAM